jgi:hypothetical protein
VRRKALLARADEVIERGDALIREDGSTPGFDIA